MNLKQILSKKSFGSKIYIEWADANSDNGWISVANAMELPKGDYFCKTNAFYIGQKDGFIIVAHTLGLDKSCAVNGVIKIPLAWIIKIK